MVWLIKNEEKIVGDHLKLYFCYIKKERDLVVMHLERNLVVIFTGIKTERWEVVEVYQISYLAHLKQIGKIVCVGIKTGKKDGLCWVWSRKNA